jgi:hypothetical protein
MRSFDGKGELRREGGISRWRAGHQTWPGVAGFDDDATGLGWRGEEKRKC